MITPEYERMEFGVECILDAEDPIMIDWLDMWMEVLNVLGVIH